MTTYTRTSAALALSAVTAATALTVAFAPSADAAAGGRADAVPASAAAGTAGAPALAWRPCERPGGPAGQECAELPVPLDYGDPAGRQLSLAVSRIRSDRPAARRGTLMVLPGGPGGSGVQRLAQKGEALGKAMAGSYDLVGFDPRGVGASTTANCGLAPEDRMLVTLRSWPDADGGVAVNEARSRRVAEACQTNGGAVLRSFTTANEVRDMDRLRQALGERKLSAWGTSYGTYVGAVYGQKYPQHTDRWVLDSSGDPDPSRVARGWLANMSQGADDRFPDFAAWAADPARAAEGLRLAERPDEVRPLFLALAATLDHAPKPSTTQGTPLTGNLLRQAMQNALYGDAAFPGLARLVRQAQDPAATPVLPPELAQPLRDEDAAIAVAVICNDVKWPADVNAYARGSAADRAAHPLTAGMPATVTPCAFWKDAPVEKPTRITGDGPSNVLMIQNLRDPATPYFGALKMREAFGDRARLVTVDHGGHGVYLGNGNACGDRAVTEFLTTGHRPSRDTFCAAGQ
ncbi:alpha/beta hydrolase [Streptomyces sp. NBC_00536]|uniref:alpha/beta hydrolase n=1 Tax=Streptomyces sp. NBC_00536 TaxID=2975769 RepID=UPI002E802390|nr:alpha/beta hydrolase [Streptomyces sp. NBC_00536]WUC79983.1 alpha/beta hydrolase [Streptomyces sp. NBC_00536]